MSHQVMLGTNDVTVEHRIRSLCSELPDIDLASVCHSSSEVTANLGSMEEVDCLLLHEAIGPLSALDLVREVATRHPTLAIVLAVTDPSVDVLGSAMEAGVRGIISSDPSLEDLETRVGNASDWSRTMRRHFEGPGAERPSAQSGLVVALAGAKGGTGTTTCAVHMALAAANARRTVCLVDMDLQTGDIPTFLDITHRRSIVDLTEAAEDLNPTALADALFAHRLGPHVLLPPREGERAEDVDGRAVRLILGSLRSRYDLVIVDCGGYTSDASAMAAELADRVIITTSPDLPSLRGARRLAELWERLQVRKREDVSVLVTRQSRGAEIQPDFAGRVLRLKLLTSTIPAAFKVLEPATNVGSPGEVTDPAFKRSIGRLLGELGVLHGAPPTGGAPEPAPAGQLERKPPARKKTKRKRESGQATVEFLGMLPYILIMVIVLWESLLLGAAMMNASHAANEGARSAAVGNSAEEVRKDAKDRMADSWAKRASIRYQKGDDRVTVEVTTPILMARIETPWSMTTSAKVVHEDASTTT